MSTAETPRPKVSAGGKGQRLAGRGNAVSTEDPTVTLPAAGDRPAPAVGKRPAPPGGTATRPAAAAAAAAPAAAAPAPAPPGPAAAAPAPAPAPPAPAPAASGRRTRRARLVIARVDPWSVMKLAFLLSLALAVVVVTAVAVLWSVLDGMGIFDAAGRIIADVTAGDDGEGFNLDTYVRLDRVLGVVTVLACANVVLLTALSTLGAFLYNLAASLVGGLHVTLSEDA